MESRQQIRRAMRTRRRALDLHERRAMDAALAARLACHPWFLRSRHIALYLPNDGEVDLNPLFRRAMALGKRCYLPVLSPAFHNRLWFAPYTPATPLALNTFRIPEPVVGWHDMRPVWTIDLVLTPLVAFDAHGNRLGMGGGFYDRTLAYLARRAVWRKPRLLGVAYRFQEHERLPHQPWDIPLDGVVTDGGLRLFGA
ncbi:MAG: 5-formyltetrahydrofolate cyclo-ligase [Thiohalomonadaceae bacterium]